MMKLWVAVALASCSVGVAQAGTVAFSYTPTRAILTTPAHPGTYFNAPLVTFSGILSGVEEGENFSFDLSAVITSAANDGQLGSGYILSQLIGTSPSITVQNGQVIFANAAFRRSNGDAFQLSTPGGDYLTGSQYTSDNGDSFIDYTTDNADLTFGPFLATPVPEPATWLSMAFGFSLLGALLRHDRRRMLFRREASSGRL